MAYFNHAFNKTFLGTHKDPNTGNVTPDIQPVVPGVSKKVDYGFLNTAGIKSLYLSNTGAPFTLGVGVFGLFTADTYLSLDDAALGSYSKPVILAASSLYTNDKISPTLGGYKESTKSKLINPKYVSKFYSVEPCKPEANVVHIGNTPYTASFSPADSTCLKNFECNTTYYLRIDIKGSPALRYLTHNAYWTADAFTGCCDDRCGPLNVGTGTSPAYCIVDPTTVYIAWANQLVDKAADDNNPNGVRNNHIVGPFINIVVYDTTGLAWFQPGTNNGFQEWDSYTSPAGTFQSKYAGMKITGAYVDTVFGNCTFYPTDFFEKEPVKIIASLVDYQGQPCSTNLCVIEQCCPKQGNGYGDTILKELILSESYMQNYFNTSQDLRIREVTQGYDVTNAIVRTQLYYRYYILHSVPRFNNPTGVFDNDQYMLEIITNGKSTSFETGFTGWLSYCGGNCDIELGENACSTPCINCEQSPDATISGAADIKVGTTEAYTTDLQSATFCTEVTYSLSGYVPEGVVMTQDGTTATITSGAEEGVILIVATDCNGCTTSLSVPVGTV